MNKLAKSWTWLKWPVALGLLWFIFHRNQEQLAKLWSQPKHWGYLGLAFALMLGSALLTFLRWYLLVWGQDFPFRIRDAVRLGFLGMLFNYVAPGSVGGDLFKAAFLAREQKSRRTVAVATVVLDRILGLLALFMVGCVATLLYQNQWGTQLKLVAGLLWLGTLGGWIGLALMLHPAPARWSWVQKLQHLRFVGKGIGELLHGVGLYQSKRGVVLQSVILSLLGHAGLIAGFYCCALSMQQPDVWIPDLGTHYYFMPIAELFGVLVPVPGGIGTLEAAIAQSYESVAPAEVSREAANAAGFAAALAFRAVNLAIAAVGLGYYLTSRTEIQQTLVDDEAAAAQDQPTAQGETASGEAASESKSEAHQDPRSICSC